MVPVLIFLYICVTEPTDPETPSAEKPTESDCKTEEENIHSNPTRLSSTNSIALLSVARPLGGTIRLPPEPWQCEFGDDSRIKTSGGPPAAAKADPLCCPPSCSPSLSLRNCELRNTTQGGTNCAAANIRPHAEWNRVVATTMVKESYANKICSFVRRLGSIIIPVVSVTIEKSTCGCDKPSYHQSEAGRDRRPEEDRCHCSAWPPKDASRVFEECFTLETTKKKQGGGSEGGGPARVRWRRRASEQSRRPLGLTSLVALLSIFSWLSVAAASEVGQQEEKSKWELKLALSGACLFLVGFDSGSSGCRCKSGWDVEYLIFFSLLNLLKTGKQAQITPNYTYYLLIVRYRVSFNFLSFLPYLVVKKKLTARHFQLK